MVSPFLVPQRTLFPKNVLSVDVQTLVRLATIDANKEPFFCHEV